MPAMMFMNFRRNRMTLNQDRGFTLVEMMIVIAVMAILAAIAAPSYQTFMAQRRLSGAARQIMSDLMSTRMKAVSMNQMVKVSLPDNHQYEIWNDANGDGTVADNEGDDIARDIQTDYHDVTYSSTANPLFYTRGTANGATITVSNSAGSKDISLAITGRVKIGS